MSDVFTFLLTQPGSVIIVFVVMGLTTVAGRYGVEGKAQLAFALGVGVVVGVLFRLTFGLPADYAGWFWNVIYGLVLALIASGIYETYRDTLDKLLDPRIPKQ